MSLLQKQRGNTLTGIIIGLVIGLAVAVVVALLITKGATPFTDKSGKTGKPAETPNGQLVDPNKPLYGKNDAAREANKDLKEGQPDAIAQIANGAKPAAVIAAQPAPPPAPAPTPAPAPAKTIVAAPATPAAAPAAPAAPAAAAAAGDEKYVYYLQAGAYRDTPDAEATKAKLALLGYEAQISDRSSDSGVLHRVRLGPYTQVEVMNKVRAKLSENGVDVAVVRNQK